MKLHSFFLVFCTCTSPPQENKLLSQFASLCFSQPCCITCKERHQFNLINNWDLNKVRFGIHYLFFLTLDLQDLKGYTLPLTISIVLSGQYEDDLDNCEEIVYTGQGGNNLLGDKRQISDQQLKRGNLGLKAWIFNKLQMSYNIFMTASMTASRIRIAPISLTFPTCGKLHEKWWRLSCCMH